MAELDGGVSTEKPGPDRLRARSRAAVAGGEPSLGGRRVLDLA